MELKLILGILAGGGLGYAFYLMIGCPTGSCPLTGNSYTATLFGGILGAIVSGAGGQSQPH